MNNQSNGSGIYLYCIIPKNETFELTLTGLENEKIFAVEFGNIYAIVSNSPYRVYELTPENLLAHEGVIREVMSFSYALPFNFGNVLKSHEDLIAFLEGTYSHIMKMLEKVSGRVELGLKILIKNEKFNDEVENQQINKLKAQLSHTDEQKQIPLKIELGKLVKKSLEEKQEFCRRNIFDYLKKYCYDAISTECITVKMILNASFLVDKDKQDLFEEKLEKVISRYEDRYDFRYTGPWPPYNFIDSPEKT